MPWARLDDAILDNPKIGLIGPLGFALHVASITWCSRNLTDGHVTRSQARLLLDLSDMPVAVNDVIAELLAVRLWEATDVGYRLHDYLDYNPSRTQVLADREAARVRKVRSRRASHSDTRRGHGVSSPDPVPVPKGTDVPIESPNGLSIVKPASKKSAEDWAVENFVGCWNLMAGADTPIPTVKLPVSSSRRQLILRTVATFPEYADGLVAGTEDTGRLLTAMRLFVEDPFNGGANESHKTYGVDTFCRHCDRWRELADLVPA